MRDLSLRLWALAIGLLATLCLSQPVLAHAQQLASDPAASAVIATTPEAVRLTFNEPVSPLAITLITPEGDRLNLLDATIGGETVVVTLPADLGQGAHVLSWRVVSSDSHPIGGSLIFSIGIDDGGAAAVAVEADRLVAIALWASKALLFAALFLGIGGSVFGLAVPLPAVARRLATGMTLTGLLFAPLSLGLQGLDALALPLDGFFSAAPWRAALTTSYGDTVIGLLIALGLALLALVSKAWRLAALPAWVLAAVAVALSGHAGAAEPQWLTRPAVALHVGGILFWIGALPALWELLRERTPAADAALTRFSRFIPLAVAPVLLSGLALAAIQLGPPGEHWFTPYAAILATKLGLLTVLFGLAVWNRFALTRPALGGNVRTRHKLRSSIAVEVAIVLAILALVAGWRFTPPPRAIAEVATAGAPPAPHAAAPIYVGLMHETVVANMLVTPGRAGPVTLDIQLTDHDSGALVEAQAVTVTLAAPELAIEPFRTEAIADEGVWRVAPLTIPVAGSWQIAVEVRLGRFSMTTLQGTFDVP